MVQYISLRRFPLSYACVRRHRLGEIGLTEIRDRSGHHNTGGLITASTDRVTVECRVCKILDQDERCQRIRRTWSTSCSGRRADHSRWDYSILLRESRCRPFRSFNMEVVEERFVGAFRQYSKHIFHRLHSFGCQRLLPPAVAVNPGFNFDNWPTKE